MNGLVWKILCGLVIGVVQDSVETMLNSSGDVVFAAAGEWNRLKKKKSGGT